MASTEQPTEDQHSSEESMLIIETEGEGEEEEEGLHLPEEEQYSGTEGEHTESTALRGHVSLAESSHTPSPHTSDDEMSVVQPPSADQGSHRQKVSGRPRADPQKTQLKIPTKTGKTKAEHVGASKEASVPKDSVPQPGHSAKKHRDTPKIQTSESSVQKAHSAPKKTSEPSKASEKLPAPKRKSAPTDVSVPTKKPKTTSSEPKKTLGTEKGKSTEKHHHKDKRPQEERSYEHDPKQCTLARDNKTKALVVKEPTPLIKEVHKSLQRRLGYPEEYIHSPHRGKSPSLGGGPITGTTPQGGNSVPIIHTQVNLPQPIYSSPDPSPEHLQGWDDDTYGDPDLTTPQDIDTYSDLYPTKPSPPEDTSGYHEVIERAASYHKVDMYTEGVKESFLFETLKKSQKQVQFLPMLGGFLEPVQQIFQDPVKGRPITPRVEKKYKPSPNDPLYIKGHVSPDSLVVVAARKRANCQATGDSPPPDKEGKRLESIGKRVNIQAASQMRVANSIGLLSRYNRAQWDEMEDILQYLPDEQKERAAAILEEGRTVSNNTITCAADAADTAARSVNTAVTLRRHAWLRNSGFKPEIQQQLLNLPFDGEHLFGPKVDEKMEKLKKDLETNKAMGTLSTTPQRGFQKKQPFRGTGRGTPTDTTQSYYRQTYSPQQQRGGYSRGTFRGNGYKGRGKGAAAARGSAAPKQ